MTELKTVAWLDKPSRVVSHDLLLSTNNKFRVNTRAYTGHDVFADEMNKVFSKTWIYIGHESEVSNPGDFKTSHVGLQPVILTRGADSKINVVVNRCVHRGSVVCREARGNAKEFQCPYHGWIYGMDGKLLGVSERREPGGYSENFDAPDGLLALPRVEAYRGFVFASFNEDVQPLLEHLGRARVLIDRKLNLSPSGEIVLRSKPYVVRYRGNWKFQSENIVDAYHFLHVHKGFVQLQAKYGDSTGNFGVHQGRSVEAMRKQRFKGTGSTWDCNYGHGLLEIPVDDIQPLLEGDYSDFYKGLQAQHGDEELGWIAGKGAASIFPAMGMIHQQIRTWRPISPDLTEVTVYPYELKGAPDSFNEGMLRNQERFYGPAGYGQADDIDIFARNQQGLAGAAVDWLILERGLDSDHKIDQDYQGLPSSEAPQRAFWREWSRLMDSE